MSEKLNLWELMTMTEMYQLEDMKQVLGLHFKAKMCHFFHRASFSNFNLVIYFPAMYDLRVDNSREFTTTAFVQTQNTTRSVFRMASEVFQSCVEKSR